MMEFITIPVTTGVVFWGIYEIVSVIVRRKERILLAQRADFSNAATNSSVDINIGSSNKFSAIRLGCLFAGLGAGLLTAFILGSSMDLRGLYADKIRAYEVLSILYGACALLFGGIGLIVSFIIERKLWNKK